MQVSYFYGITTAGASVPGIRFRNPPDRFRTVTFPTGAQTLAAGVQL